MRHLIGVVLGVVLVSASVSAQDVKTDIDWNKFLARHDLVWEKTPTKWEESAFVGNGLLGMTVYSPDAQTLCFNVGRSDVVFKSERIPVGELHLKLVGKIQEIYMRQSLWNAEVIGDIQTDRGHIGFKALTHADQIVNIIGVDPDEGEAKCKFEWKPGVAAAPRKVHKKEPLTEEDKNPTPVLSEDGHTSLQPLQQGEHCTVWQETAEPGLRVVYLSVGYSKDKGKAQDEAQQHVARAKDTALHELMKSHVKWWHEFYSAAFVSIPDTRLESFYWIQIYKLASATRADRPAIDLNGPWFRSTPWPKIWWNLNIQLTYWPVYTGNRLELGESLCRMIDNGAKNLAENAREFSEDSDAIGRTSSYDCAGKVGDEICNLPWALHNYWLQYRYSMDESMLRDRLYPRLKRSINYYLHLLKEGPDGKLHITRGLSPEYPEQPKPNPDCNMDLALVRWGLQTLIESAEKLKLQEPMVGKWKQTLEKLVAYPVDDRGLKVSSSVSFDKSHRHYSHMLMIYPLYLMNAEQAENLALINKSMENWLGMPAALRGYSFTGAASMYAMLGRGDEAIKYLNQLLDNKMKSGHVHPNTQYTEAGPVIETPLSGAASLHDMLLTSWGGKIRVLPGVPKAWKNVSFHNLRAEGAFLVSAVKKDGKTQFVKIESLAGAPGKVQWEGGEVELSLKKGESLVLRAKNVNGDLVVAPVQPEADRLNMYGLR